MDSRSQMRRALMMHEFFFETFLLHVEALRRRPFLFKQTASIQDLWRNPRCRFSSFRLLGSFFPDRTEIARGPVLINQLKVPSSQNRRQRQPAQEFFKIHSHRVFALERSEPEKRGQ